MQIASQSRVKVSASHHKLLSRRDKLEKMAAHSDVTNTDKLKMEEEIAEVNKDIQHEHEQERERKERRGGEKKRKSEG